MMIEVSGSIPLTTEWIRTQEAQNHMEPVNPDSGPDPDLPDPYVFGPPGSVSTNQRYGSISFCNHAKIDSKKT